MSMKIVYMGTPEFAAIILQALADDKDYRILAVYTQPDRPAGRGQAVQQSAVKTLALQHNLEVRQPENFKKSQANSESIATVVSDLQELQPDILIVAAYGLILPQAVLDIPKFGAVNVHASLLPEYRGAAPIQRCIIDRKEETGVSIMAMEKGMDTGAIYLQEKIKIKDTDTSATLHDKLAKKGAEILLKVLKDIKLEQAKATPQDHNLVTYAAKLTKADGQIDFSLDAKSVHAQVRGVYPWPGSWFDVSYSGGSLLRLNILPGCIGDINPPGVKPGQVLGLIGNSLAIACADRVYLIDKLCPAAKKFLSASAFVCGYLKNGQSMQVVKSDYGFNSRIILE